jgi:hypothetical protein
MDKGQIFSIAEGASMEMKSSRDAAYLAMVCLGAVVFFSFGDFLAKEKLAHSVGYVVYLKTRVLAGEVFRPDNLVQVMVEQKDIPGKAIATVSQAAGRTALYDCFPEILTSYMIGFPGQSNKLRIPVESYSDSGHLHEYSRLRPPALVFNDWLLERLNYENSPRTEVKGDYFFFPYRNCVLMTVPNVKREKNSRCLIKANITEVLRGNIDKSPITLSLDETEASEKAAELESLPGKTCIVAFNELWRESFEKPLPIYCFSTKYIGNSISDQDLQVWKRNLSKSLFPYQSCWLVTIQPPEPILKNETFRREPVDVTVRIDEMFVKEQNDFADALNNKVNPNRKVQQKDFRVGNVVQTTLDVSNASWYHSDMRTTRIGSRAIWAFNPYRSGDRYFFENLHSPFPGQDFNEHDIARLRKWLAHTPFQMTALQAELQRLMTRFWTEDRIRVLCRSDNVLEYASQALVPGANLGPVIRGTLHSDKPELGKITWYTNVWHGEPDTYELDVVRGDLHWRIISHCPDLLRSTEANFVKRLIEAE